MSSNLLNYEYGLSLCVFLLKAANGSIPLVLGDLRKVPDQRWPVKVVLEANEAQILQM